MRASMIESLGSSCSDGDEPPAGAMGGRVGSDRELQSETGAGPRAHHERETAAVRLGEAHADGQAEAGSFAHVLGSEEGLEDPAGDIDGDAGTGIRDLDEEI